MWSNSSRAKVDDKALPSMAEMTAERARAEAELEQLKREMDGERATAAACARDDAAGPTPSLPSRLARLRAGAGACAGGGSSATSLPSIARPARPSTISSSTATATTTGGAVVTRGPVADRMQRLVKPADTAGATPGATPGAVSRQLRDDKQKEQDQKDKEKRKVRKLA